MILDTILEEAGGMLCGLPPGTVTAVSAAASVASTSASPEDTNQVEQNTRELSEEEKAIVEIAVHNIAVTVQRAKPFWSRKDCAEYAMAILLLADEIYSDDDFKAALVDAVSANPKRHLRLITNVEKAVK